MILTNSTFLNSFLCNYNWHGKDPNSIAKKQAKALHTNIQILKILVLKINYYITHLSA